MGIRMSDKTTSLLALRLTCRLAIGILLVLTLALFAFTWVVASIMIFLPLAWAMFGMPLQDWISNAAFVYASFVIIVWSAGPIIVLSIAWKAERKCQMMLAVRRLDL